MVFWGEHEDMFLFFAVVTGLVWLLGAWYLWLR